eukprot:gb/GECG01010407.1/.p1 GENE.gb/GECG01010407.1/~~gb/GECG01010407.1/.p1  ORF type:complete len:234 (+),score=29.41 gb/GECG01010407.1/:1-702(+)
MSSESDANTKAAGSVRMQFVRWLAVLPVFLAISFFAVDKWLAEKSYEFSFEEVSYIAKRASKSFDTHEEMFLNITKSLQQSHPTGISAVVQEHPWIFINAGGWMGAYSLLYSSLSEYVLLFGTPIGSGGHSGRYWAHIEDTTITGTFHQWPEGSTRKKTYGPSSTVVHRRWEATNVYWEADTWMVEYARGFIPSAMPFALADSLFSAQDVLSIWKSVKMYGQEVVRNMWSGRF